MRDIMKVEVLKLDNFGRGITYINDKICFIKNALPNEIVEISVTKETNKFFIGGWGNGENKNTPD